MSRFRGEVDREMQLLDIRTRMTQLKLSCAILGSHTGLWSSHCYINLQL